MRADLRVGPWCSSVRGSCVMGCSGELLSLYASCVLFTSLSEKMEYTKVIIKIKKATCASSRGELERAFVNKVTRQIKKLNII